MNPSDEHFQSRRRKARKIKAILQDHLGEGFRVPHALDIGCRQGSILAFLDSHFETSIGVDRDPVTIEKGRERHPAANIFTGDGLNLAFPDNCFDLILCAQVYEHVADAAALGREIKRVLKPGGTVFFSGPNRLAWMEEHYHLPLLAWLPRNLANCYLRLLRGVHYYNISPLFEWQLRKIWRKFKLIDYTQALLGNPKRFALEDRLPSKGLPNWISFLIRPLIPNFNWILVKPGRPAPIPPSAYTHKYYLNNCAGHGEYKLSQGHQLPKRLWRPLEIAAIQPGERVLDIGCGRGELAHHCHRKGAIVWGLDYAPAALHIAQDFQSQQLSFQQAEAQWLPFVGDCFNIIFMLDIVEHLHHPELQKALSEVWRVLKPGGKLIIHSMPNLDYYRYGYPVYRGLARLGGRRLPRDPRQRWGYPHLHVNEQTPQALKICLQNNNFESRVWLENLQEFSRESSPTLQALMSGATRWPIFKHIFCNDILAVARKPKKIQP
jgi:ubiquinone/menaquinone biosynthesis C-methylase UbiE